MTFVPNEAGIKLLFTDTTGLLAQHLEATGDAIVVLTQETIGDQWPVGRLNPPAGPPFRRSGDMQASIRSNHARVAGDSMEVDVTVDAAHRGFNYPELLLQRGYQFVDLGSLQG